MQEYKRLWINVEAEMEKGQEDGIRGTAPQLPSIGSGNTCQSSGSGGGSC